MLSFSGLKGCITVAVVKQHDEQITLNLAIISPLVVSLHNIVILNPKSLYSLDID